MSSSNWFNRCDMSPERNNHYRVDNVALQLGLGLPVELIGVTFNGIGRRRGNGQRSVQHKSSEQMSRSGSNSNEIQETIDGIPIRKVYIPRIDCKVERRDIVAIFKPFGQIMNIYLSVFKNDPYKKFGFVTFADPLAAARVLSLQKFHDMRGGTIHVVAADSWHQPKEGADGKIIWRTNFKTKDKEKEESEDEEEQSSLCEKYSAPEEIIEVGLNLLNDDCLLHIFSFLPLQEITRMERVCKRWQGLSYRTWRCLHTLSFYEPTMPNMQPKTSTLASYLRHCGPSLRELDMRVGSNEFDKSTLAVVAKHCSNLEVLRVEKLEVGYRSFAHIAHNCLKLKELVLDDCTKFEDKDIVCLLSRCDQLSVLHIAHNASITGRCFSKMQCPLSSLYLNYLPNLDTKSLAEGLLRVRGTLKTLELRNCRFTEMDFKHIVTAAPDLTSLSLSRSVYGPQFNPSSMELIGQLRKLTSLNLSFNRAVNNKMLTVIVDGCENLTNIDLSCSGEGTSFGCLSEEGLSLLGRLKRLTHLDISYLQATTDTAVKNLTSRNTKIQELVCRGCPDLTDEGCVQVVTVCNNLELFDLSGCSSVSRETVSTAFTSVKMRTNNVPLKLIIGGTDVEEAVEPDPEVPLLTVDMTDLSMEHLRPDFIDNIYFPPSDSDEEEDLDHLSYLFDLCSRLNILEDSDEDFDYGWPDYMEYDSDILE